MENIVKENDIEMTKTYIVDEGKTVSFFNYKTGERTDCDLQHHMIFGVDDLIGIKECTHCENLLYRFYHSKKKCVQVERTDLEVLCHEQEEVH